MKYLKVLVFCFTLILPSFAYANDDGCGLIKALYDSKDYVSAFNTAKTYAADGGACAEYYLGVMYYTGYGTRPNGRLAVKYLNNATRKGYKPAKEYLSKRGG